jgi:hypothetical protein
MYLADVTGDPAYTDRITIVNPHFVPVGARVTFVEPDGSGHVEELSVPRFDRVSLKVSAIPEVAGGAGSAVVQTLHPAFPHATHEVIWTGSEAAGRATEGVRTLQPVWYFPEGFVGGEWGYTEQVTVFNPSNDAACGWWWMCIRRTGRCHRRCGTYRWDRGGWRCSSTSWCRPGRGTRCG